MRSDTLPPHDHVNSRSRPRKKTARIQHLWATSHCIRRTDIQYLDAVEGDVERAVCLYQSDHCWVIGPDTPIYQAESIDAPKAWEEGWCRAGCKSDLPSRDLVITP